MIDQRRTDAHLATAEAIAGLAVILLAPWVGARTDHRGRRLPTLIATTLLTVVATSLLATFPPPASLVLLGVALVGLNVGSVVYDALLVEVSTSESRGRLSGLGVSLGYLGSFVGLGLGVLVLEVWGLGYAALFRTLAAAFILFSLPAFLWIRERPRPARPDEPPALRRVLGQVLASWRSTKDHPGLTRFLVGRFLYTDAINTLIGGFLAIFAQTELGLDSSGSRNLLAVAIAASIGGGLVAARLVDRIGPLTYLRAMLVLWTAALGAGIVAAFTGSRLLIWTVGVAGGVALGGTWSSDRVAMIRLSPPARLGEYYGLYATVGRFATVLGPLVWTAVAQGLGWGRRAALGALIGFIVAAWVVLVPIKDQSDRDPPDRR